MPRRSHPASWRLPGVLRSALLLTALFAVTACALFVKQPRVTIADVQVVSLGILGGSARVSLRVDNPNRFDLELRSFSYRLQVADGPAGEDEQWVSLSEQDEVERDVVVPGREEVIVDVPVDFSYLALGSALRSLLLQGEVRYRVEGAVRVRGPVGEHQLPFTGRGILEP